MRDERSEAGGILKGGVEDKAKVRDQDKEITARASVGGVVVAGVSGPLATDLCCPPPQSEIQPSAPVEGHPPLLLALTLPGNSSLSPMVLGLRGMVVPKLDRAVRLGPVQLRRKKKKRWKEVDGKSSSL